MNLHKKVDDFRALVELTSEAFDLEPIYVEKDYFVVLSLKGLSESEYKKNGIFKGGTALSKSYHAIDRFSEDIDLVAMNDSGDSPGSRKLMRKIEKALTSDNTFIYVPNHPREKKGTNLRQTAYHYRKSIKKGGEGFGQISPELFIDVSRIVPAFPFEIKQVVCYIHDYLNNNEKNKEIDEFGFAPVEVNTLSMQRIFTEKFGTVVKYASQDDENGTPPIQRLKDGIRHIYDLHCLLKQPEINEFLRGKSYVAGMNFNEFLSTVLEDDLKGMKNIAGYEQYMNQPFANCMLYGDIEGCWKQLQPEYIGPFKRMVYMNFPEPQEIVETLNALKGFAEKFDSWKKENNKVYSKESLSKS